MTPIQHQLIKPPTRTRSTFLGSHYEGRDAIAASYAPLFRKRLQGSRLTIEVKQVRFLTPDVALIRADAAVAKRGRRSRRPSRINTSVAVRTADGWMLAASQNTTRRRLAETLLQGLKRPGFDAGFMFKASPAGTPGG